MSRPVLRFAPSPNGELHLGHALSALVTWETARRLGGRFLLRIEDIDIGRCRPEYETAIYEILAWLGLDWEEPVRRQSDHFDDYEAALATLKSMGLVYPCFVTRAEIAAATKAPNWPRDPDGAPLYPGLSKGMGEGERTRLMEEGRAFALRIDIERAQAMAGPLAWTEIDETGSTRRINADPSRWGDVVIARKDVPTSYHLSVTVDDAIQGITHVTRGRDLYEATAIHRLLQTLLCLPEPVYAHHRLIAGADGRKLSKSRRDTGLKTLRAAGATPDDIRRMIGTLSKSTTPGETAPAGPHNVYPNSSQSCRLTFL